MNSQFSFVSLSSIELDSIPVMLLVLVIMKGIQWQYVNKIDYLMMFNPVILSVLHIFTNLSIN